RTSSPWYGSAANGHNRRPVTARLLPVTSACYRAHTGANAAMTATPRTERYEVDDPAAAIEFCFAQGWTDGLPVVPPAVPLVEAFLRAGNVAPGDVIGEVPTRRRVIMAAKVAANAVMAGCPA